jgi:hypothetical protein
MSKGETRINADELAAINKYCKVDMNAAIEGNRDAKRFINRMKESGMVGNSEFFKKLAWLLFIVFGLGGGAIGAGGAALAGGNLLTGAMAGAGSGALAGAEAAALTRTSVGIGDKLAI